MRLIIIIVMGFIVGYMLSKATMFTEAGHDRQLEVIEVEVTAYSPSVAQTDNNPWETASQRIVKPSELEQLRLIAVSRDLIEEYDIKWGDKIWVAFTVEDTMNKRIETTVDIFFRNQDLARKFGRQVRTIIIERRGR